MQAFADFQSYHATYLGLDSGKVGRLGQHDTPHNPCLTMPFWNRYPTRSSHATNPAGYPDASPFWLANCPPLGENAFHEQLWSGRDPNPAILWSRGISSPCFLHDHHVIIRNTDPPFSAGNWEIDRRHMIEVHFDRFGVASHCRSTWGRTGPWRDDRYQHSVDEAHVKLQADITMLLSRLGLDSNDRLHQAVQGFGGSFLQWINDDGIGYPYDDHRLNQPLMASFGFPSQMPIHARSQPGFRCTWNTFMDPFPKTL